MARPHDTGGSGSGTPATTSPGRSTRSPEAVSGDRFTTDLARSVQHLVTSDVPVLRPDDTVDVVRRKLGERTYESVRDLPVCSPDGLLVGVVRIEQLVAAPATGRVADIIDATPPRVAEPAVAAEVAAWQAVRRGESSLLVTDASGRFEGLVPPDRLLGVLLAEHEEDVARLGGFATSTPGAAHATEESVAHRLGHRLPWLVLGLAGALATAGLMGSFEAKLEEHLLLALFVPGIVYLADAVGTQTEAIVIRGLAVGVRIRQVALRELITGVAAGALLALAFVPVGLLIWGDVEVVVAVAGSLWLACAIANGVAMLLPALLDRFKVDPAFGSGPLATVVQDLLSILIYLGVASAIVT